MKRTLSLCLMLTMLAVLASCGKNHESLIDDEPTAEEVIVLDKEQSFFHDFRIDHERRLVGFRCSLTFQNTSDCAYAFHIKADFGREQETKLLEQTEAMLIGQETMWNDSGEYALLVLDGDTFLIGAGETLSCDVTFTGKWGGGETKTDRNLPDDISAFSVYSVTPDD